MIIDGLDLIELPLLVISISVFGCPVEAPSLSHKSRSFWLSQRPRISSSSPFITHSPIANHSPDSALPTATQTPTA
jgi:hypothetical protein